MKKLLTLTLAFLLAGCGAISPAQPTVAAPPPSPIVVIATVLVPVTVEAPTQAPAPTNPPAPQVIVVTATQPAQAAPPSGGGGTGGGTATATLPSDAGGSLFTNLTRSGSFISLRCLPQDITFNVSTANFSVVEVDFYYRMEDLTTQPITYSDWKNAGKMVSDKNGNFTIDFNVTQINEDLRATDRGWLDYQFVGIAKDANAVGRSGKITQQIQYLKDCP
jgi:hypothetical protein